MVGAVKMTLGIDVLALPPASLTTLLASAMPVSTKVGLTWIFAAESGVSGAVTMTEPASSRLTLMESELTLQVSEPPPVWT